MPQHPRFWETAYPPRLRGYEVDTDALPSNAVALLTGAVTRHANADAFVFMLPDGRHTGLGFDRVDALSDAFAAYLVHDLGLQRGDVLAVQLPNCLHYPVAVFGAWKAGVIVTNVNPLYTPRELQWQLEDSGARVLLACDLFLAAASPVAATLGIRLLTASLADFFERPAAAGVGPDAGPSAAVAGAATPFVEALATGAVHRDPPNREHPHALYQYTGGTTGRSKAAVITHRNILSTVRLTHDFLDAHDGPRPGETMLTVLPLYHIFAFTVNFLVFLDFGARNLLIPSPRPIANLRSAFEHGPIEWMAGVDTLYAGLLAEPWFRERPPALRYALSGGTALRPSTAQAWQATVCPILEGYGLTETTCIVACNPPTATPRVGTVGLPMPGCDVRIVGDDGRPVAPHEKGELLVRGPQVIAAYLHRSEESRSAIVDGWLHTGDIAQFEADGYLRIVDRKKDIVIVSGFNVYPNEVEDVIAAHPDVAEVAVIGVPDESTGEAVRAFVTPRQPGLDAAEIIRHCRTQLTAYKVPKQVVFRAQLPKSAVGKILRAQLRTESL